MKRAVDLFEFEAGAAHSPLVERVWHTRSVPEESFISVAASNWEIVITRQDGGAHLSVLGPETSASTASIPQDAEFFGIRFNLGTFMPRLTPGMVIDHGMTLSAAARSVWLDGSRVELPGPDDVDCFVAALVRKGLLAHDPVVPAAITGQVDGLSVRSLERRVARATGLTRGTIRQIHRAEAAAEMLVRGAAPIDVAFQAGYADQPHLTRSLRRFVGQTPAEIAAATAPNR